MAWTTPMTAVANAVFTAAEYNLYVRDNLLETEPAKATTTGSLFVGTEAHTITERRPDIAVVATSQQTTSATYTNLATSGPAVTVTTGERAIVMHQCLLTNSSTNSSYMSHAVTGATTAPAEDSWSTRRQGTDDILAASLYTWLNLTPGSNTFTAKYRVAGTTGTFADRRLVVIPF